MATAQAPVTVPDRPGQSSSTSLGEPSQSGPVQFRGFDFFANRDYNQYRDASRAYFAEKQSGPSSWLGDATPPASARPSAEEPQAAPIELPGFPGGTQPENEGRILGLRRRWFWALVVIIIFIVAVAVGVGVGVGVGTKQSNNSSKDAASSAADSAPNAAIATSSSPSVSLTTAEVTTPTMSSIQGAATTAVSTTTCPGSNGTIYTVPGSTEKFLRLCGVDASQEDGAVDVGNVYTSSAIDCINACATTADCTGCGWGFIEGDQGPLHRCWLKNHLTGKSHAAEPDWNFAILEGN
ncbi:hypothetical protein F4861DRAFT_182838 [Xylaria intraflava]|nr:hypothetical protein F4861DRAFT_182838 [Xylaria intraflava]